MNTVVEPVDYDVAPPAVREIYDDIMKTRQIDFVPNFWRAVAHDVGLLRRTWETLKEVMGPGALDPLIKEMVAVAVSATNGCEYCIRSHAAGARKLGMTDEMFGELMAVVGLFNQTNRLAFGYQVEPDANLFTRPQAASSRS